MGTATANVRHMSNPTFCLISPLKPRVHPSSIIGKMPSIMKFRNHIVKQPACRFCCPVKPSIVGENPFHLNQALLARSSGHELTFLVADCMKSSEMFQNANPVKTIITAIMLLKSDLSKHRNEVPAACSFSMQGRVGCMRFGRIIKHRKLQTSRS